jgi:hypothetical protein
MLRSNSYIFHVLIIIMVSFIIFIITLDVLVLGVL